MAYQLSATKLQTYHRCPQAYYFRYELRLRNPAFFGSATLGTALHQALAQIHRDWHYMEPLPRIDWIHHCWEQNSSGLSPIQEQQGREILENYYHQFIAGEVALHRPLAVEGKIQGLLRVANLEFVITGRYDRLDYLEAGLELIDYKSTKQINLPEPAEIDLQIGLYYLALEQRYHSGLRKLSLLYLRSGEKISFDASPKQKQQVEAMVGEIACRLRTDALWEATTGEHCALCTYSSYCSAVQTHPEPLPDNGKASRQMQLVLNL